MKKSLLFACAVGIAISAAAQNRVSDKSVCIHDALRQTNCIDPSSSANAVIIPAQRQTPLVITNTIVTDIAVGGANNLLGAFTRPGRPILDFHPALNALTFTHRSCPACTPSDGTASGGYFTIDVSTNGGSVWNSAPSLGPIIDGGANQGRYPQGVIFNPPGNTIPDSAFIIGHGAALTGAAAPWAGYHTTAATLGDPTNFSAKLDLFDSTVSWRGLIPDAMVIANGTVWVADAADMDGSGTGGKYADTLILRKGTWNAATRTMDYNTTLLPFSIVADATGKNLGSVNIAFSSDGQTGYLTASGCASLTFAPDSSYYLTIWKTTNGGATWGTPTSVSMDVNTQMGTTGVAYGSTWLGLDGAVDNTGKLHLITSIHKWLPGQSVSTAVGEFGMFSIISDGTTNTIRLLDKPMTFAYTLGAYSDYNRGQIALSQTSDKVFYVWFDTDTVAFPGGTNSNPNAIARMFDVATSSLDGKTLLTAGSAADGTMFFGFVAYWAGSTGSAGCGPNSYNIHLGYQLPTGVDTAPVTFHYVGGACITGVQDATNVVFNFGEIFPNPTSGLTTIEITMKKSDKITVEVTNMLGQAIYTSNENLTAGDHTLTVDASKWNSGVYFYTVKSVDFSITKKMVRE